MSLRSDWDSAKNKMANAGVDASLFSKAFGPALDNYESADKDYAAITSGKDPNKLAQALTKRKTAATSAFVIADAYGVNLKCLEQRAKDARQKAAFDDAGDVLMNIKMRLKKAR
jgi:hypothetical protein